MSVQYFLLHKRLLKPRLCCCSRILVCVGAPYRIVISIILRYFLGVSLLIKECCNFDVLHDIYYMLLAGGGYVLCLHFNSYVICCD